MFGNTFTFAFPFEEYGEYVLQATASQDSCPGRANVPALCIAIRDSHWLIPEWRMSPSLEVAYNIRRVTAGGCFDVD